MKTSDFKKKKAEAEMAKEQQPQVCPSCGRCPTCGHGPYQAAPRPWRGSYPYPYVAPGDRPYWDQKLGGNFGPAQFGSYPELQ